MAKRKSQDGDPDLQVASKRARLEGTTSLPAPQETAGPSNPKHAPPKSNGKTKRQAKAMRAKKSEELVEPQNGPLKTSKFTPTITPKAEIRKLAPPRPFPVVPRSVSATGPRSAHKEGKNKICVSRKTPLGAYLRKCKALFVEDDYKVLQLYAMGAAIPHLTMLAVSLPLILPFPADEIHTDITTESVELQDEVLPADEDEDITIRKRSKSALRVIIRIGDAQPEPETTISEPRNKAKAKGRKRKPRNSTRTGVSSGDVDAPVDETQAVGETLVFQEAEQEEQEDQDMAPG
ncbi:hypothetical protein SISNIDRAFT_480463 [Sistotremastrum niveocremeum HHB9708]|uniref:Uncharacterized protein n=1 Tax=Sistotremastrum niveocremeum HHB9708 TaxID=1314777 RepID=A0A165AE65_9AGAM|nr:hypothetical protein SISNIDRAFT_480463 [Sistotremastrum niveocremeum HHB9708]